MPQRAQFTRSIGSGSGPPSRRPQPGTARAISMTGTIHRCTALLLFLVFPQPIAFFNPPVPQRHDPAGEPAEIGGNMGGIQHRPTRLAKSAYAFGQRTDAA